MLKRLVSKLLIWHFSCWRTHCHITQSCGKLCLYCLRCMQPPEFAEKDSWLNKNVHSQLLCSALWLAETENNPIPTWHCSYYVAWQWKDGGKNKRRSHTGQYWGQKRVRSCFRISKTSGSLVTTFCTSKVTFAFCSSAVMALCARWFSLYFILKTATTRVHFWLCNIQGVINQNLYWKKNYDKLHQIHHPRGERMPAISNPPLPGTLVNWSCKSKLQYL